MGPAPAAIARIRDRFRWHVVLKVPREADPSGSVISRHIAAVPAAGRGGVRMTIDTDPQSLM
jgi:primosomal protein N'